MKHLHHDSLAAEGAWAHEVHCRLSRSRSAVFAIGTLMTWRLSLVPRMTS